MIPELIKQWKNESKNYKDPEKRMIMVSMAHQLKKALEGKVVMDRTDLEYLALFRCEHGWPTCEEANRGALCNSCWIKAFAEKHLPKKPTP